MELYEKIYGKCIVEKEVLDVLPKHRAFMQILTQDLNMSETISFVVCGTKDPSSQQPTLHFHKDNC